MRVTVTEHKPKQGFALIVVLSGLLTLTLLFAITSTRQLNQLQSLKTELLLVDQANVANSLMEMARSGTPNPFEVQLNGKSYSIRFQDVGGLIDLNTASPALRAVLFSALEIDATANSTYVAWRASGNRLGKIEDLLSITGADYGLAGKLLAVATVHSGRTGVAPDDASEAVKALFGGTIPSEYTSPSSRVNFQVLTTHGENVIDLGVVSLLPNQSGTFVSRHFRAQVETQILRK